MTEETTRRDALEAGEAPIERGELNRRFRIEFDKRLPALDAPCASAVEAADLEDSGALVYALLLRAGVAYRAEALDDLRTLHHANLLRVAAHGIVEWSRGGRRQRVIVLDRPQGGPLIAPGGRIEPWTEDAVVTRALPAMVDGLGALHRRGIAHRAVRPGNLFFMDAARKSIVLGECVSASAGRTQPSVYEPIERAMAQPSGRGAGAPECDLFALGVTLLALLLGHDPLAGMDETEILDRRLSEGSCAALVGNLRVTPVISDLLGGLLCDTPKHRWSIEKLGARLAGRRGGSLATEPRPWSLQPYKFLGVEYFQTRALACAFARNWDAAQHSVREGRLVRWLKRSANQPEMARAVSLALEDADRAAGRRRLSEDDLVGRVCLALDPGGPVRYRGFAAMLDGFGPALADAMVEGSDEAVQAAAQAIASGLAARAVKSIPDGRIRLANSLGNFVEMEAILRNVSRGYGIERCLYELNPNLPCQSPIMIERWAENLDDLLLSLDAVAEDYDETTSPADRHIAAFIGCHLAIRDQERLHSLSDAGGDPLGDGLAVLATLALVQERGRPGTLPGLTGWVAGRIKALPASCRNRGIRRQLERDLRSAGASGSLVRLFQVATDPERRQRDRRGFRWAIARRAAIRKELARIEDSTDKDQHIAEYYGRRIAAGTAYLLLAVAVFGFAFRGGP